MAVKYTPKNIFTMEQMMELEGGSLHAAECQEKKETFKSEPHELDIEAGTGELN